MSKPRHLVQGTRPWRWRLEERFALGWRQKTFPFNDLLPQTSLRAVGPTRPEANLQHLFCLLATSFVPLHQTKELVQIV